MTEKKYIDPRALATLTTGVTLIEFGAVHEAAEWILGRQVWTHQFPALADALKEAVHAQFPDMPTDVGEGWEACRDWVLAHYGPLVAVSPGGGGPVSPWTGLPDGLAVIGVKGD